MASVRSLGVLEPSALPYLIAEDILPPDASPDLYRWRSYPTYTSQQSDSSTDEILVAQTSVVWSRCGIIKKVLNLNIENDSILQAFTTVFSLRNDETTAYFAEEALVVLLKNQIHVSLLSGDNHVLPLSFEAQAALPCTNGFILQRKIPADDEDPAWNLTSAIQHDLSTINESQATLRTSSARPSLLLPTLEAKSQHANRAKAMPRTFSCTDPMSELGLVVCGATDKARSLDDCKALPSNETVVYLSRSDEMRSIASKHDPLCLAVTVDPLSSTVTIWHVAGDVPPSARTKSKKQKAPRRSTNSHRKSSNIYGKASNAVVPNARDSHPLRQSFGHLAQSYAENVPPAGPEKKPAVDLADQLGPEFEQTGVQTRSSRRVSSMLARTDLVTGNDRTTFNELAMGHAGRKSMGRTGPRGESIGSFGDRQSFGLHRKSSFHAATSVLSTGTSFLNVPGYIHTDRLDTDPFLADLEDPTAASSDLQRDLGFFKLTSFNWAEIDEKEPDFQIFSFPSPRTVDDRHQNLSLCLLEKSSSQIAIVSIQVESSPSAEQPESRRSSKLKATSIKRGTGISSACSATDGNVHRLLLFSKTRHNEVSLHLEAPWSPSFRIELPQMLRSSKASSIMPQNTPDKKDEAAKSTISATSIDISHVKQHDRTGSVVLVDFSNTSHSIQVQLAPKHIFVAQVLSMSNMLWAPSFHESLLVAFWEVSRWLKDKGAEDQTEWAALVITIFTLAVPFLDDRAVKQVTPSRRKKAGLLRSSSGSAVDLSDFKTMVEEHGNLASVQATSSWAWLAQENKTPSQSSPTLRSPRHARSSSLQTALDDPLEYKHNFVTQCISQAREFVQTPTGEGMIGPEGYLPTAISKDRTTRQTALATLTIGLHLLQEEQKLCMLSSMGTSTLRSLPAVLAQLGTWLGWSSWTLSEQSYYGDQYQDSQRWLLDRSRISGLEIPAEPFGPPSILQYICESIAAKPEAQYPTLDTVAGLPTNTASQSASLPPSTLTPLTTSILSLLSAWPADPGAVLSTLRASGLTTNILSTIPDGIAAVFYQATASSQTSIGRGLSDTDSLSVGGKHSRSNPFANVNALAFHHATRDYHNAGVAAFESETAQRWDISSEADRQAVSRTLFQADRRFQEASRLVNQTRAPLVECTPHPDWSEAALLEAQKELAQLVARRTLAVASGRAMMHYSAREPLLTERVPIPVFSLQCLITSHAASESAQAMTFSADKSSFTEEKVNWAFFHNGTSAGLMISRDARCVDTSWILYNKPQELTNRHAGFLLALGLNGHLRSLAKWVAFKYLTPKHTMTSIGLLLGLSASYLGTQDQLITRLMSVHVTRLLPLGAAELNISPLTQATGIMGIGLLYVESQHRRMSEVMLSEIENSDSEEGTAEEQVLRNEGYRLAAGFALGLINLGQGRRLHSLHDMAVSERLLGIAIATKNVNLVHVLDRATSGAVMAIAFIYMKTNESSMAAKIDVPDTIHQFDYVRPDVFLLRTLARHLIMWDSIAPTQAFVTRSLPKQYQHRSSLHKTMHLATEDLPFFNILAGICFALGLRYAGSQRADVRDLLVSYLDHFLRLSRLPCPHYDARVTVNGVRNCLDIVALAAASVMAGSGDLAIMRRLRSLHGRTDKDTPFGSHMAAHMALGALFLGGGTMTFGTSNLAIASLCIAFYPLFPNDVLDNKCHLQALRHLWVLAAESRCLVCKEKERGTLIGGVIGDVLLKSGGTVIIKSPGLLPELDSIDSIVISGDGWWSRKIDVRDSAELEHFKKQGIVTVHLTRKAAYNNATSDIGPLQEALSILSSQSMKGRAAIPSCNADLVDRTQPSSSAAAGPAEDNPFEWLFGLRSFRGYDSKEQDLVLENYNCDDNHFLNATAVDARLAVERGLLPDIDNNDDAAVGGMGVEIDKLYQLKALISWFDKFAEEDKRMDEQEDGVGGDKNVRWSEGTWLRREFVEALKQRVFSMV